MCDFWIFGDLVLKGINAPYSLWKDNVKTYELKQVMQQENKEFMSILNKIRTCSHTDDDLRFLNTHFYIFP